MMVPGWPVAGWVRVEVGNRITRQMTRLPSGEIRVGEPEPNSLGLGFFMTGVGDGGSALWYGVVGRSLIMRSAIPRIRGSTTGCPLFSSVAGVLLGPANCLRSTCDLGL
jgi:hypothetical protein